MRDAEASTTPAHTAQSAPWAEAPLQAPDRGPAAEAVTDSDEARKRARHIERFAPPTPYEIAMAAATATAARMAAGRAHDWSARETPADELGVANHTRGVASAVPSTRRTQVGRAASQPEPAAVPKGSNTPKAAATDVAKGACDTAASAIAAPTPGMPQHCAIRAISMPVPAGEPEAARVPEAGSAAATEERVANGACDTAASAIAAPTPGMPQHCAIRAISMPVPAGEPEATRVPEAGSAAATEERVANGACAIAAPTPGTPYRQAIRATSMPAPAAEPGATTVPEGGSPTVAEEGVTSRMRTIVAPSPGDQTGRADKAARTSRAAPVAVPNGSSKRVAKGTRAIDAPTPGTLYRRAVKAPHRLHPRPSPERQRSPKETRQRSQRKAS
jgi:hypothetical protein